MEELDIKFQARLLYLLQRYGSKTLSTQEEAELLLWVESSAQNQQLLTEIPNLEYTKQELLHQQSYNVEASLKRIKKRFKPAKRNYFYMYTLIAASLIVISLVAFYFYNNHLAVMIRHQEIVKNDLKPGNNKAVLTLANGTTINLTDVSNGQLAEQAGIVITKTKSGQLVYMLKDSDKKSTQERGNNTITTPKGGQYQIILPDGSIVWLNAASSLTYPSSFKSLKNRKVSLIGEAYFEISHNKEQPFIVKTAQQEVEVLGTHFNINSYPDEADTKTTLLEGSIQLINIAHSSPSSEENIVLKPGQQSINKNGIIKIVPGNTEEAVAWKNGYFMFTNERLESIMKKVSRWYDVQVEFENGELKEKVFSGSISRFGNISQVIDKLELTGSVHFSLKERRIVVMD